MKSKCCNAEVFLEGKGSQIGVYCSECGKWQKWANKDDIIAIKHKEEHREELLYEHHGKIERLKEISTDDRFINKTLDADIVNKINEIIEYINKGDVNGR